MEEKINIVEILKDKPQGTKLYSSACGKCKLEEVDDKSFKISFYNSKFGFMNGGEGYLDKNGKLYDDGECVVFPSKEMRDWSKFAWKKGDILLSKDNDVYIIFEKFEDDAYTRFKGKYYLWKKFDEEDYSKEESQMLTSLFEKVNDYEAKTYINTIEERLGGKLNLETLEIEKAQPEFKDGDIVTITFNWGEDIVYIFKSEDSNSYSYYAWLNGSIPTIIESSHPKSDIYTVRLSTEQEKQKLFEALAKEGKAWDAEKKMIVYLKPKVELKPFDKVLVRDGKNEIWEPAFFFRNLSHLNVYNYQTVGGESRVYCIPFNEETAKLIGTTDDWEG
jgi:hypothetical protein